MAGVSELGLDMVQGHRIAASPFDRDYLQRLIDRDPEIERHFADFFGAQLRARARSYFRDPSFAEDVAQETLMRVIRIVRQGPGIIEQPERLSFFVFSVCTHVMQEVWRRTGRYQSAGDETLDRADLSAVPDQDLLFAERRALVRRVLEELSDRDRSLLVEVFWEETNKEDLCEKYGVDRDYLRVLLFRALGRFRTLASDNL